MSSWTTSINLLFLLDWHSHLSILLPKITHCPPSVHVQTISLILQIDGHYNHLVNFQLNRSLKWILRSSVVFFQTELMKDTLKNLNLKIVEMTDETAILDGGDVLFTGMQRRCVWIQQTLTLWCLVIVGMQQPQASSFFPDVFSRHIQLSRCVFVSLFVFSGLNEFRQDTLHL